MREIKFRAWDKRDEKMLVDDPFSSVHPFAITPSGAVYGAGELLYDNELGANSTVVLMQYTGLKDKNGVEIYESDILQDHRERRAIIVWHQANCEFLLNDLEEYQAGNYDEPAYIIWDGQGWLGLEVVGNIYENPELLGNQA